jgi:hypothetical protein
MPHSLDAFSRFNPIFQSNRNADTEAILARRLLFFCIFALVCAVGANAETVEVRSTSTIEIVYITAGDCVYCRSWRYMQAGGWARFEQRAEAKHVNLVSVDKGVLRNSMKLDYYPERYRNLYELSPRFGNIVPAWWILLDGKPVLRKVGETGWDTVIEPAIIELVAAKMEGGGTLAGFHNATSDVPAVTSDVQDSTSVPFINDRGRENYKRFLSRKSPRAFAISRDGSWGWADRGKNPQQRALDNCNAYSEQQCRLYAVDNEIVYSATPR